MMRRLRVEGLNGPLPLAKWPPAVLEPLLEPLQPERCRRAPSSSERERGLHWPLPLA